MKAILYTLADVRARFDADTYDRGTLIARKGLVRAVTRRDDVLQGMVGVGTNGTAFEQQISLMAGRDRTVNFGGECNCRDGINCKHIVAVLLSYLGEQKKLGGAGKPEQQSVLPHPLAAWLQRIDAAAHGQALASPDIVVQSANRDLGATIYRQLYVLAPENGGRRVALAACKARLRSNGEIAAASIMHEVMLQPSNAALAPLLDAADGELARWFIGLSAGAASHSGMAIEPKGKIGAQLLQGAAAGKKLFWANSWADLNNGLLYPMKLCPKRGAALRWTEQGDQARLGWQFQAEAEPTMSAGQEPQAKPASHEPDYILSTEPPWFIDNLSCGELSLMQGNLAISVPDLIGLVAQAPLLAAPHRIRLSQHLLMHGLQHLVPMPEQLQQSVRRGVAARPHLLLGHQRGTEDIQTGDDYALLSFAYDGQMVASDPSLQVVRQVGSIMEIIERDQNAEAAARDTIRALGFGPVGKAHPALKNIAGALELPTQSDWLRLAEQELPRLIAAGWQVEKAPFYRYEVCVIEDWYAQIDERAKSEANNAWFELELGIVVNQQRVSLLPVLLQLIRKAPDEFNARALLERADSDLLLALLADGVRVALPWGRIKPILTTLGELYFNDKISDKIRLSTFDVGRLAELADADYLHWTGGERLRALGKKLRTFGGVVRAPLPRGLKTTLREYQRDGLSWMQFLRKYELAGILADDMGLGKTVQTLAHILLERQSGRMRNPVLVVAPTSLMGNWQDEAARFTPGLRVLLLHGVERAQRFDQIQECDLVLTTYALLTRDEEILRQHQFYMLILDESHYIKNNRSKAAQSAGLLQAKHRLCLTGTPLENHLGELWSQFHFLMPGLLGDEKTFNTDFRNPIEKQNNQLRCALLSRRIKPFLLRRTKDKVAKELPPKTEMVRQVELVGPQRDLYETVRLAMDKKVRDEIAKKGVTRSQIVILEALLKLRQVCCDPRLIQTSLAGRNTTPSAKLVELMQMIEDLLDEGRKILVFSQFTSMLKLIQDECDARAIVYALLTGVTKDRAAQVAAFQQGAVPVFLISLKAGGVGLNLTAADTVIHYDPWWNPAAENQATDRAWRIGQDKPVFVYKLIAKGTLEEKIQELQQRKSALAQAILADGPGRDSHITQTDLQMIFAPMDQEGG